MMRRSVVSLGKWMRSCLPTAGRSVDLTALNLLKARGGRISGLLVSVHYFAHGTALWQVVNRHRASILPAWPRSLER
jgi:hypothetical protein